MQLNAAGQVELKLKTPWRDGTTHLVMSPPEFMQRLVALGKRPATTILTARAGLVQRQPALSFQRCGSSSSTRLAG